MKILTLPVLDIMICSPTNVNEVFAKEVASGELPLVVPAPGSIVAKCPRCNCDMWLERLAQSMVKLGKLAPMTPVCLWCGVKQNRGKDINYIEVH